MAIGLVIIAALIGMIVFLAYLATVMDSIALKVFFGIMSMLTIVISLNTSSVLAEINGSSQNLIDLLNTSYTIGIWVFFVITFFLILMTITHLVSERKLEKEREEDE